MADLPLKLGTLFLSLEGGDDLRVSAKYAKFSGTSKKSV